MVNHLPPSPFSPTAVHGGVYSPIRVLLVDDHTLLRQSLRSLIEDCEYMEVVGEASNGVEALEEVAVARPDVVVMDINMPVMNGIEATERIKADYPDVAVIGLSMHHEKQVIEKMQAAGISSFLTKASPIELLCRAIEDAAALYGWSHPQDTYTIETANAANMKSCPHCQHQAEWRYKEGWGVLACADWFGGTCEGQPLDVSAPSGRDVDEEVTYSNWVKRRLRQLWPLEQPP